MADQIRRGGLRRPVVRVRDRRLALVVSLVAAGLVMAPASSVGAHGGEAGLQLGSERINPGGTIEVVGDMTTDGPVALTLIADGDGTARPIATLAPADDGHFQAFIVVPVDVSGGSYTITAGNGVDVARAPIVIAGAPAQDGEQGQLPGQDEALAGAVASAAGAAPSVQAPVAQLPQARAPAPAGPAQSPDPAQIIVVVLSSVGVAVAVAALARRRAGRAAGP